jgi:predicted ester cyclase
MPKTPEELGRMFFLGQDESKGGPPPGICAPGYTATINANPPLDWNGHDQFGKMFYGAFPNLFHKIEDTVTTDDAAVIRFSLHGTHTGDFMGMPPTGKEISVMAIAILKVADGKITRLNAVFDQATMMQQLTS